MIWLAVMISIIALMGMMHIHFTTADVVVTEKDLNPKEEMERLLTYAYGEGSVTDLRVAVIDGEITFQGVIVKRRDDASISNYISKCSGH